MKLRKWIAGITCACMMLTLSPPAAVLAETAPQAAAQSTTGDVTVTSGSLGTEDSFENGAIGATLSNTTNIGSLQRMDGFVENAERFTGNVPERAITDGVVDGNYTINSEYQLEALQRLTVNPGAHLTIDAKLTMIAATIINNGTLTVTNRGEIVQGGTIDNNGTLINNGTIDGVGDYINSGTFTNNGTFGCITPFINNGTIINNNNNKMVIGDLNNDNGTVTNNGTIDFNGFNKVNGTVNGNGTIILKPPVNSGYEVETSPEVVVKAKYTFKVSNDKSVLKEKLPFETEKTYYICRDVIFTSAPPGMVQTEWAEFSFPASSQKQPPNVTINYANGTLTTNETMEYRLNDGNYWGDCSSDMSVAAYDWFGKTVQFRTKGEDNPKVYPSKGVSVAVPAAPVDAPTVHFNYSAETFSGTDDTMEYRVDDSGDWKNCTSNMKIPNECFGQNVQLRIKAVEGQQFASAVSTVAVPTRLTTPTLSIDNADEGVTVPSGHRYKVGDAQNWTDGTGGLVKVPSGQTIVIYKPETDSNFKSLEQTLTAPSKGTQPSVTIDYDEETLSTTTAMEYRLENGAWKDCSADMKVTEFGWNGTADLAVEFRTKATDKNYASDVQNVTIAKRPAVPEGVTPTHVSVVGRKDGALNGVSTDMEYKLATAADWTPCNGTEVSGLAAGTYEVRVKATKQAFASEAVSVTIKKGAQLAVDAVDLGKVAYGYEPKAHTITITNNGDCDATIEKVAVSKDSHFEVAGAGTSVTAGGTVTTYTIQPKAGLNAAAEKPYTDTITVTYNNGVTATADVAFTVTKADPVVTAPAANDLTYNRGEQALVTAGTTNGGTLEYRLSEDGTYSNAVPKATNAGSYTVYYRVVGDSNFNSAVEQSLSVTIQKAPQVVPAAPEAENVTLYAITLKTVADANGVKAEYGIKDNDGNYQWQETPLFENLSSGTSYTFKVRYVESANYLGAESAEAVIHTNSRPTYPPIVPEVEGGEVIIKPSRPTSGQTVIITPKPNEGMEVDKVEVTDKNGNQIEVTQKPNGDFTFKQPSGKVTITVTFKPAVPSDFPFIDVPEDAWYRGVVEYVYNNSLIMGVAPNLFAPNMTTDRGQLVTMLWRLAGEPQAENSTDFGDVPSSAYYAKAVAWAAENGITAGFEDGTFRPTTGLSREQMAALFMKYAQAMGLDTSARADISGFTDINPDSWSYDALSWAKAVGLLNGVGDATMAPQDTATRAQIAAVLQRYCETIAK